MSFSSLHFLFVFLPSFLVIYFIVPAAGRNAFLFAASMVFYMFGAWSRPQYIGLLLFSGVVNFWIGKAIEKTSLPRLLLSAGIACNLAWLCLFKYSNLLMPLGISFYTFRSISYLVDVYRKEVPAAHAFVDFGAYLTFFPQVISGPIEKYREMREELKTRPANFENIDQGLKQFTIGLGFKMLLADRIGSCWNDIAAIGFDSISAPVAWMGIFAYSFELYFDFYGYSLMAAGIAKMIGFETPDNFTHPKLVPRICLYPAWRKPPQHAARVFQPFCRLDSDRNLAWRGTEFHPLGVVFIRCNCAREGRPEKDNGAKTDFGTSVYAVFNSAFVDDFCN